MLPAHIAASVREQVLFYLQSTFDFRDKTVERAFFRFLEDPESGLFKGPWVQLKRPYRPADKDDKIALGIKVPFLPYKHQVRAWRRLSSQGQTPRHTLVTTGTGSGKTECFTFPILDHCLRACQQGQKGIKAIILYPMNALAADQERRLAAQIWKDAALRTAGVRVGNYTGRYDPADPAGSRDSGFAAMGQDHGVSNHEAQLEHPPDILLTNYKMLDFLLLRPQDQGLWRLNEKGTLKYLVLDELHTYDGAQGADVACLIRRLKERLDIDKGQLCVVGTSATIESRGARLRAAGVDREGLIDARETGKDRLAAFAGELFEEEVPAEAVIGEERLEVEELVRPDDQLQDLALPDPRECEPRDFEDAQAYSSRQSGLWGGPVFSSPSDDATAEEHDESLDRWGVDLGDWLRGTRLFRYLLDIFHRAEQAREEPLPLVTLVNRLSRAELGFNDHPEGRDRTRLAASFFALVASAMQRPGDKAVPLVPTQVQLWIRELRRMGRVVSDRPSYCWLDEPLAEHRSLPTFHCSECGESGWVALHDPSADARIQAQGVSGISLRDTVDQIYRGWFGRDGGRNQYIVVISPWGEGSGTSSEGEGKTSKRSQPDYLCPTSLVLRKGDGPCPLTGDGRRFRVRVDRRTRTDDQGRVIGEQGCPACGSREGVFFIGSQSATLSSVAIDEMFGSLLNSDPKLLAFTDSVQDASHRAGFFTSRTYHFTFRTALQHVIDDAGEAGILLREAGEQLLQWWAQPGPGRPGSYKEAMACLMPPDLHQYDAFLDFRNSEVMGDKAPASLARDIEARLTWEATSEFGLMQTHGRTMEGSGASAVAWDRARIDDTLRLVREHLPGVSPALVDLSDEALQIWLLGILHRYRLRGAMYHPYLDSLAHKNFWGKAPFRRTIPGRETHPLYGRFTPSLMVTKGQRGHVHVLAPTRGHQSPWHVVWSRRALALPDMEESTLLDLIQTLLEAGSGEPGLFRRLHQDGTRDYYAIDSRAARLVRDGVHLACSESGRSLVRSAGEAKLWEGAVSMEYYSPAGRYRRAELTPRQRYYQDRYRKGALRRVVAQEHTGLLATGLREGLERSFSRAEHLDDPNVLTCTSTLEMGIDIGDLSSTMLCSIPPNTASYLQRIGRAGRATGTALIISIVNQRPHDLFFYARPSEMLRGKVDPPGCWLDASAVLVRQYLAFCIDSATHEGKLTELPSTGAKLVADLENPEGHIPRMMVWVTHSEQDLRRRFLARFKGNVQADTRARFTAETDSDELLQKIHKAASEYDRQRKDLQNARRRLQEQRRGLDEAEEEARMDIEREIRILSARQSNLGRTNTLELLTDHGLLPNYAFPERGVRFHGAVYNRHSGPNQKMETVDITRAAAPALKDLAPSATYYTHSRRFKIQQIGIGSPQQPLVEEWAICGACGHMRRVEELEKSDVDPACPQCGYAHDAHCQQDQGQHRRFIEFPRSQALSYMEQYESLSADRSEERQRGFYQILRSFDLTLDEPSGAVGEEELPFGIEYRAAVLMREINTGYKGEQQRVHFGAGQMAPETGFLACRHCGVVVPPHTPAADVSHRRSCPSRRRFEKMKQEGRGGDPFRWENVYLYRRLRSEAIRLLLPMADDEDIDTLIACIYLGLRLRFEGNPAYLHVSAQVMPDPTTGMSRYYLILMDAVPGGTGYLKTLYQEVDEHGRAGEGVMDVLRRARVALESCACRRLQLPDDQQDPDGCYRCIRTYHLQYNAGRISRERGIDLLGQLIQAGERRVEKQELQGLRPTSLFDSMLEKRFVDALRDLAHQRNGSWEPTIIRGNRGYRFSLPGSDRYWDLEMKPHLGPAVGVAVDCEPDFMLRCDDDQVRPVAVFTDGFEFHCHPHNRLADDMRKRRAILDSGGYHVWSITWHDLTGERGDLMVCHEPVAQVLRKFAGAARGRGQVVPEPQAVVQNGLRQLAAFLEQPHAAGWAQLANFVCFWPLQMLAAQRTVLEGNLVPALERWRTGEGLGALEHDDNGDWVYNDRAGLTGDLVTYITVADALSNRQAQTFCLGRLGDTEAERTGSDYLERWRRFLACLNLLQFCDTFRFWVSSEVAEDQAPDLPLQAAAAVDERWLEVAGEMTAAVKPQVLELASLGLPLPAGLPEVEYFADDVGEEVFAELAWPDCSPAVALLAGEQADYAGRWQERGWKVVVPDDLQARGVQYLADLIATGIQGS